MEDRREELSDLDLQALDLTVLFMRIVGWHDERIEHHVERQKLRIRNSPRYDIDDDPVPRSSRAA